MGIKFSARTISYRLPTIARKLGVVTEKITEEAAEFTRTRWSEMVRVSPGEGNYDGAKGGTAGHYRDNIFIRRVNKNSWIIETPVPYAPANEFVHGPASAALSAEEGFKYYEDKLRSAIAEATSV